MEKKLKFASGATSTVVPRFELIPRHFMVRLSARFEKGIERHGDAAWNARSSQDPLDDKAFLMARLGHVIDHATKLMDKLDGRMKDDGEDDAGAIGWAAALLCEATNPARKKK